MISFAATAKLICVFVFAYAKSRFSHNEAHISCFYNQISSLYLAFAAEQMGFNLIRDRLFLTTELNFYCCYCVGIRRPFNIFLLLLCRYFWPLDASVTSSPFNYQLFLGKPPRGNLVHILSGGSLHLLFLNQQKKSSHRIFFT